MTSTATAGDETQFNRGTWLMLLLAIVLPLSSVAEVAYRFTLATDGWEVNEASDLPGFTYTKDLLGTVPGIRPGDQVIAIAGIPATWETIHDSAWLRATWRAGATLDYTVLRQGEKLRVPVTLANWQVGAWLLAILRDPGLLAGLFTTSALLALAAFVFLRTPGTPAAGAYLLLMAILAAATIGGVLPVGFTGWIDPLASFVQRHILLNLLITLFPFALVRFALVFPHPKPIQRRHPWLSYGVGGIGLFLALFASGSPIGWFWFVFSFFLSLGILVHNAFTMKDAVSRAQMRWGVGGIVIGFGILALMFLVGTLGLFTFDQEIANLLFAVATTVMGGMLAVAILRYRLWDIDVIIRRTLVYTILTAALALVYFGTVILLEGTLRILVRSSGQVATVISTLAVAAMFAPLRRRVQAIIDRRFYRRKYDAERALAEFAAAARDETDLEALTEQMLSVVQGTVQPDRIGLWLSPQREKP